MKHTVRVSRQFSTGVQPTPEVIALAQMFGIGLDVEHTVTLYKDLAVELGEGRVILIIGESGAGKSCLLRDLRAGWTAAGGGIVDAEAPKAEVPLVNLFGPIELQRTCDFLSLAGLAEPNVMIRRPSELSDGQRYRLMLALAMANSAKSQGVAFIDEFGAFLDRRTAKAVSANVRKIASRGSIGFVLATTHEDLTQDLDPDTVIRMRLAMTPKKEDRHGPAVTETKPDAPQQPPVASTKRRGKGPRGQVDG